MELMWATAKPPGACAKTPGGVAERTNLRHLAPEDLYGPDDPQPDLAVADLSFISLSRVLEPMQKLLAGGPQAEAVLLVKPQFEVGRERVGKGGVVRDPKAHADAIALVAARTTPAVVPAGVVDPPITGAAGNHEYLLWLGPKAELDSSAFQR